MSLVTPAGPRHTVERDEHGQEQLRIPMRRNWLVVIFLPFWLVTWTIGGVIAMYLLVATGELFVALWLVAWALGWTFAAAMLAMQIKGSEVLRVERGELEICSGAGALRRSWRYSADAIRDLSSSRPASPFGLGMRGIEMLFFVRPPSGAVHFTYGAQTIHLANAVDEPEGRMVAQWLARRLPQTAVSNG